MDTSNLIQKIRSKFGILYTHMVLSVLTLASVSVWAGSNDIYTSSSSYEFYWFTAVFTFLFGVTGCVYHKLPTVWKKILPSNLNGTFTLDQKIQVLAGLSVMLTLFWLSASASVASLLSDCLSLKKNLEYLDSLDSNLEISYNYHCNGEIMSVTFGFVMFIVWGFVSLLFCRRVYRKLTSPVIIDVASTTLQETN